MKLSKIASLRKKWLLGSCVTIMLIFVFVDCWNSKIIISVADLVWDLSPTRGLLYGRTKDKLRTIELGMTEEQVEQIMGPPIRTFRYELYGRDLDFWWFPDARGASEPSRCVFDVDTGKVIEVRSGEDYFLKGEDHYLKQKLNQE